MTTAEIGVDLSTIALFGVVLNGIPPDAPEFLSEYRFPAPAVKADSFDDLYAAKEKLQDYRLLFRKTVSEENGFPQAEDYLKKVTEALSQAPIFLNDPTNPYVVPDDTKHLIMWHRDGTDKKQRAEFLTDYLLKNNLGEKDFFIVSSVRSRRSVQQFEHSHVFVRSNRTNLK